MRWSCCLAGAARPAFYRVELRFSSRERIEQAKADWRAGRVDCPTSTTTSSSLCRSPRRRPIQCPERCPERARLEYAPPHPMLNIAVRAARKAGSVINRASLDGAGLEVRSKHQNDFVTRVDTAAEEAILDVVRKAYPDHAILAEESGAAEGRANTSGSSIRSTAPPTSSTASRSTASRSRSAAATALAHGVVYDPNRNELFTASKGSGAYLNDRRIRVSKPAPGRCPGRRRLPVPRRRAHRSLFEPAEEHHAEVRGRAPRGRGGARPCLRGVRPARRFLGAWTLAVGHGRRRASHPGSGRTRRRPGRRVRFLESGEVACATPKIFPTLLEALRP